MMAFIYYLACSSLTDWLAEVLERMVEVQQVTMTLCRCRGGGGRCVHRASTHNKYLLISVTIQIKLHDPISVALANLRVMVG